MAVLDHIYVCTWQVLVVSVLGLLPLVPRNISNKAYRLSLLGTTCSSLYSIYTLHGVNFFIFSLSFSFLVIVFAFFLVVFINLCIKTSLSETQWMEYARHSNMASICSCGQGLYTFPLLINVCFISTTF